MNPNLSCRVSNESPSNSASNDINIDGVCNKRFFCPTSLVRWKHLGFIKALKKEKNLLRLNRRSNMHVKWMDKMVVVVKCRFLVTLIGQLHQFAFINPIKFIKQIKECSKL